MNPLLDSPSKSSVIPAPVTSSDASINMASQQLEIEILANDLQANPSSSLGSLKIMETEEKYFYPICESDFDAMIMKLNMLTTLFSIEIIEELFQHFLIIFYYLYFIQFIKIKKYFNK